MNIRNWVVGGIIILAGIGLGYTLFYNPLGLLRQLLLIGVTVIAIYALYRFLTGRKPGNKEKRSFSKAAKQSQRRTKQRQTTVSSIHQSRKKPLRKKSVAHLTVIEGKKNKKKDKAIF